MFVVCLPSGSVYFISGVGRAELSSTYKYSVRLQRFNSPRGLYLEARYNGFFELDARKIHYSTYCQKVSCKYPDRGVKKRNYTPDGKKRLFSGCMRDYLIRDVNFDGFSFYIFPQICLLNCTRCPESSPDGGLVVTEPPNHRTVFLILQSR